jgi:hypothetical protein
MKKISNDKPKEATKVPEATVAEASYCSATLTQPSTCGQQPPSVHFTAQGKTIKDRHITMLDPDHRTSQCATSTLGLAAFRMASSSTFRRQVKRVALLRASEDAVAAALPRASISDL